MRHGKDFSGCKYGSTMKHLSKLTKIKYCQLHCQARGCMRIIDPRSLKLASSLAGSAPKFGPRSATVAAMLFSGLWSSRSHDGCALESSATGCEACIDCAQQWSQFVWVLTYNAHYTMVWKGLKVVHGYPYLLSFGHISVLIFCCTTTRLDSTQNKTKKTWCFLWQNIRACTFQGFPGCACGFSKATDSQGPG